MSNMTSYNWHQIRYCAVPIATCLIQPTMTFMMQHYAISSDSTARLLCFKYTVNSLVLYLRRTNFHLVLRVVHAVYFFQKIARCIRFLRECVLRMARFSHWVWFGGRPCIPRNRLWSEHEHRNSLSYTSVVFVMVASLYGPWFISNFDQFFAQCIRIFP